MKKLFIDSLSGIPNWLQSSAISIGNFDGVHLGHRKLIDHLLQTATNLNVPSLVVTFDPSPATILYPNSAPPALTWIERRAALLHDLGVDIVVAIRTDADLLALTPEDFFQRVLVDQLHGKAIVEGPNFRFGQGRRGDVSMLHSLCAENNLQCYIVQEEIREGEWISSSRVRKLIQEGEIGQANQMLTAPYRILGRVASGAGRGTGLGFPTANLVEIPVMVPMIGVYAGRASFDGKSYRLAINIGPNPTFGESQYKVEAHFLDTKLDLVGRHLEIEFLARIRTVQKFQSVEQLQNQLRLDLEQTRSIVPLS